MIRAIRDFAAITLLAVPALSAEPEVGARLGQTAQDVGAALAAEGYDMPHYEREEGRIKVYAVREDRRLEVDIDAETGSVVEVEEQTRRGPWPRPGTSDLDFQTMLSKDGYDIVKYERARGEIEVYARRDEKLWEIEIDPQSGRVTRVEEKD